MFTGEYYNLTEKEINNILFIKILNLYSEKAFVLSLVWTGCTFMKFKNLNGSEIKTLYLLFTTDTTDLRAYASNAKVLAS